MSDFIKLHSNFDSIEEVEYLINCLYKARDNLAYDLEDTQLLETKIPSYADIIHELNEAIKNLENEETYLRSMNVTEEI